MSPDSEPPDVAESAILFDRLFNFLTIDDGTILALPRGVKPKVYIETTIVSYLTANPSRDIIHAAHQQLTRDWWARRHRFELFVSESVLTECVRGDRSAAQRRVAALQGIPVLTAGTEVFELAEQFSLHAFPVKAFIDAVHVAVSVVHGMDYLLTWNCRHIANARIRGKIDVVCCESGLELPIICTPEELMEN